VLLFINSLHIFSGINACFAGIFYGSDGINHPILIFIGIRELKVRQIDHNIIFPACCRQGLVIYSNHGYFI
jgi:hypothetical protein